MFIVAGLSELNFSKVLLLLCKQATCHEKYLIYFRNVSCVILLVFKFFKATSLQFKLQIEAYGF